MVGNTEDHPHGAVKYLCTLFNSKWDETLNKLYDENTLSMEMLNEALVEKTKRSKKPVHIKHATWQFEKCPETGSMHVHIALVLSEARKFQLLRTAMIDAWSCTRHNFRVIYNLDGAVKYCSKAETRVAGPFVYGAAHVAKQGKRNDIDDAAELIGKLSKEGKSNREIMEILSEQMPRVVVKFPNGIKELIACRNKRPGFQELEEIILYVGSTGSGKSHRADALSPGSTYKSMYKKNSNLYFDGYNGHETLLFEEFAGGITFTDFKGLMDRKPNFLGGSARWQLTGSAAGSNMDFRSKRIALTSNSLPTQWYSTEVTKGDWSVIARRFSKIVYCGGRWYSPAKVAEGYVNDAWEHVFDTEKKIFEFFEWCKTQDGLMHDSIYNNAVARWKPNPAMGNPFF